jgi:hypothetical protein
MAGKSHGQLLAIEQIRRITDIENSAVRAAAPVMRRDRWCAVEISMDVTGPSPEHPGIRKRSSWKSRTTSPSGVPRLT